MSRSKWSLLATLLFLSALVLSQPAHGEEQKAPASQSLEDHLKVVRGDVLQKRESALRTVIELDENQAKAFWPLKEQYDAELKKIGESREVLLREYVKVYQSLSAEKAADLATRSLKLDDDRNALRRKYFDLMSRKVSPVAASQFLQLQRQFETMMDLKVQTVIPLAGS